MHWIKYMSNKYEYIGLLIDKQERVYTDEHRKIDAGIGCIDVNGNININESKQAIQWVWM